MVSTPRLLSFVVFVCVAVAVAVSAAVAADSGPLGPLGPLGHVSQQPQGRVLRPEPRHVQAVEAAAAGLPPCPVLPSPLPATLDTSSGPLHDALAALDSQFTTMFQSSSVNATGGVVAITYGDQVLRTYTYGATSPQDGQPVDEHTAFGIGSVSKLFPVYSLFQARDAGKLSLDTQVDSVNAHYQPQPFPGAASKRAASLADLGSHMSGIGRYAPCTFGNCSLSTPEALALISNWTLQFPPGSRVSYCNTGFSVLGRILEGVFGKSFEEYVASNILKPLGMADTTFTPPLASTNLARPYVDGTPIPPPNLGWSTPAGGIYSSAADMTKLLQSILRQAPAGSRPDQLLDATTLREWLNRRVWDNPTEIPPESVYFEGWGIPWQIASARAEKLTNFDRFFLYTKDGSVPGYHTQVVLSPDLNLGVFASMTVGTGNHGGNFYTDIVLASTYAVVPAVYAAVAAAATPAVAPNENDYIGTYELSTLEIEVSKAVNGTGLTFTAPVVGRETPTPLVYLGGDVFNMGRTPSEVCFTRQGGSDDYNVKFTRNAAGDVVGLMTEGLTQYPWAKV